MELLNNDVLSLLVEHRLATPQLLQRYFNRTDTQIKNELRSLRAKRLIESFPFIGKQVYYRLTDSACRQLSVSRRYAGPPGPQALRHYVGLLHFASREKPPRHFLSDDDWQELAGHFASSVEPKPKGDLYLDIDGPHDGRSIRLGKAIVDGRAEPSTLLQKATSFLKEHRTNDALRRLVTDDEFLVAYITESESKADAIADAAHRASFPHPIRLHVAPDLSLI